MNGRSIIELISSREKQQLHANDSIYSCTSGKQNKKASWRRDGKLETLVLYGRIGHHGHAFTPPCVVVRIVKNALSWFAIYIPTGPERCGMVSRIDRRDHTTNNSNPMQGIMSVGEPRRFGRHYPTVISLSPK